METPTLRGMVIVRPGLTLCRYPTYENCDHARSFNVAISKTFVCETTSSTNIGMLRAKYGANQLASLVG